MKALRANYLQAPILFVLTCVVLLCLSFSAEVGWIQSHFDLEGRSIVEQITIWMFWGSLGAIWLRFPKTKGEFLQRTLLSLIIIFALIKETDTHLAWVQPSGLPGATHGTPFKMKFLRNPVNPLKDRLIVLGCFVTFFAVCGGTLLWYLKRLVVGIFRRDPIAWTVGTIGGCGILIQLFDRAPSVLRKKLEIVLDPRTRGLFTAFEEGLEFLLPILIVLAVWQAWKLSKDEQPLASREPKS